METMLLTEENLLRHNGGCPAPPSADPVAIIKTRIKNTLRGLRKMGPEGIKAVEECDICTDGSTLSYRGSETPEWDSIEFWERHLRTLNGKFQMLSIFFNYQWDPDNRFITNQHGGTCDENDVRPWIVATTCKAEVPADGIWCPPAITPYAEGEVKRGVPFTDRDILVEAPPTATELDSSHHGSEGRHTSLTASQEAERPPEMLRSAMVTNLKRGHNQISS